MTKPGELGHFCKQTQALDIISGGDGLVPSLLSAPNLHNVCTAWNLGLKL